jgi:hypothetical protein
MHIPRKLKNHPIYRHSGGPIIKIPFALAHSLVVAARVHADVGRNPHIQSEFEAPEALFYGLFGDFELRGGNTSVVVDHPEAIGSPDYGGAAEGAACCDARTAFARFVLFAEFGG